VFERFTERARQVVVLAQEEARSLRHNYIGTEHILLGLLREEEGFAARVLGSLGVTIERVRPQTVRIVGSGEEVTSGQIPFTPRAKKVLELALREALSLGHDYIGTEHILLGLVRENEGVAMRVLLDNDVDAERIRGAMLRALGGGSVKEDAPPGLAPEKPLDWRSATLHWRPEGLELRVPLRLGDGAMAAFAADEVWARVPLAGLRREIWRGWVGLASPTLLDDVDPLELRRQLDAAAGRASEGSENERARAFLQQLREEQAD